MQFLRSKFKARTDWPTIEQRNRRKKNFGGEKMFSQEDGPIFSNLEYMLQIDFRFVAEYFHISRN